MAEMARKHHADSVWDRVMGQIRAEMTRRQVHPSRTVVLVPYAQLMQEARSAWLRGHDKSQAAACFLPRIETSMNWTRSLGGFEPGGDDVRLDAARDVLTAASMLARAGLAAQQELLSGRLMKATWSLARLAAAATQDAEDEAQRCVTRPAGRCPPRVPPPRSWACCGGRRGTPPPMRCWTGSRMHRPLIQVL